MTSIPSPFDALRALLPGFGRDGGPGALLPDLGGDIGDTPEMEEGRPRESHGRWHGSDGPDGPVHAHLRSDGSGPLSHSGAGQLADTLANALRQNPSHPLFRELQQLPPETLRQLLQVLSQPASAVGELPGQAEPLARATAHAASEARNAAQHLMSSDARAIAQAQAQPVTPERAAAQGREALLSAFAGRAGEDVRGATAAPDGRAAAETAQRPVLSTLAALLARGDGVPGAANAHAASPAAHATVPQGASPPSTQDAPVLLQQLQARLAGELATAARADGAVAGGDATSSIGLPGMVAAGVTLAAVGNPAGTTFAIAPQAATRPRQAEDARNDARKRVTDDTMREEYDGGEDRGQGNGRDDARDRRQAPGGERQDRTRSDAAAREDGRTAPRATAPHAQGGDPAARTAGETRGGASAGGERAGQEAAAASVAAAGHTVATGLMLPRYRGDEDADEARLRHAVDDDTPDDDEAADERRSQRRRWLYWALIAVAYSCLGLAVATLAPELFDLPIAPENRTKWRHALTAVGLASALWAWLLARRMR